MTKLHIKTLIEEASQEIGITWPLYRFVTSNPLSGYEKQTFKKALDRAASVHSATMFPEAAQFRKAFESGMIDEGILKRHFAENGIKLSPESSLEILEQQQIDPRENSMQDIDRIMSKWLATFLDEGLAEWSMPGKEKGFYPAMRALAKYDKELKMCLSNTIPETAAEAIENVLAEYPENDHSEILRLQVAALPGWAGYIKYRVQENTIWQQKYPIDLEAYLAWRLLLARALKIKLDPEVLRAEIDSAITDLQFLWLKAWETTWQEQTLKSFHSEKQNKAQGPENPDAQMVFCIDTRSEPIRRHVEASGNYETFGYAGFFGITMDYQDPNTGQTRKSCPPIVPSSYAVSEAPRQKMGSAYQKYLDSNRRKNFIQYFLKRMKNMLPSTFGFVEGSGLAYGAGLFARTMFPRKWYQRAQNQSNHLEHLCEPAMSPASAHDCQDQPHNIPLKEQAAIVSSGFNLMGWKNFAPLVVFTGHGSHTTNNPFGSSLDCGACAASPGRHNARMLAQLANTPEVRALLKQDHGIDIPEQTWFLGAEHNTTTDEIVIFEAGLPETHKSALEHLKTDLKKAQVSATQERLNLTQGSVEAAEKRAGDWAQTRPEWGLAKNAGFIIAPRTKTRDLNLEGRCFLHSYDWKLDTEGKFLEGIMQGPMVVTQWINNHYYFATVNNQRFGGGSKITQNVTGMFGVVQGNGGDLKSGLPLQSLWKSDAEMHHQPLRLSVIIEAPLERVSSILERNEHLKTLLDNEWIHLIVNDPLQENQNFQYLKNLKWSSKKADTAPQRAREEVMLA